MSSADLVVRYARQRLDLGFLGLLAAGLAVIAAFLDPSSSLTRHSLALSAAPIAGLIIGFRVWDDLADRDYDRVRHPDRVMPRSATAWQFVAMAWGFAGVSLVLLAMSPQPLLRFGVVAAAAVGSLLAYGLRKSVGRSPLSGYLVLTKYPLFAYAAMPGVMVSPLRLSARGFAILGITYLAVCLFETIDDADLRASLTRRPI